MTVVAKRAKAWKSKLVPGKAYPIDEALGLVKEFAGAKFNESVDVAVNLGIDASKSDQQERGSTVMPHGTGKTVRVAVFTSGKNQEAAKAAPVSASVFKAFNTIFRHVLEKGRPNVFIAGDNAQAKAGVAAFIASLGLRPLDVGGLKMAHWLEGTGLVMMGLARHGVGNWDFALGVTEFHG